MGFPPWEPATHCTGGAQPGALAFMRWFVEEYGELGGFNLGIYNCRSVRGGSTTSCHGEGRAADLGFPVGDPDGDALLRRLLPVVGQLGIQAIIYERRIYSAKSPAGRPYTGAVPHLDHLHVEFTREAAAKLTYATVVDVMTPGLAKHRRGSRVLAEGMTGTDVRWVQRKLEIDDDGIFGPITKAAVETFEHESQIEFPKIKIDGIVGAITWQAFGVVTVLPVPTPDPDPVPEPPKPAPHPPVGAGRKVRVGTRNVKTGGGDMPGGGRFAPEQERMSWALWEANARGDVVLTLQEFSTVQAAVIDSAKHPRWAVHSATPNVHRNGKGVGNGLAYRQDLFNVRDRGELKVHVGKVDSRFQIPEDLHLPWLLLEHKVTGKLYLVIGVHYPAGKTNDVLDARRVVTAAIRAFLASRPAGEKVSIAVAGDTNGKQLQALGSYVEHRVDRVASPNRTVRAAKISRGWVDDKGNLHKVSDHFGLSGELAAA